MKKKDRQSRSCWVSLAFFLLLPALFSTCRLYRLSRKLPPEYADFYSKVRYIITKQEEKIFLELPDSEKDQFIEEFWARRDPDPNTEENEFKIEYFDRLEKANELFVSEGKPGWLTDRGRIYILFGPPMDRITDSLGDEYGVCQEVWYYGNFPVVFRDPTCTGNYQLVTYDLTPLRDINLFYMHELSMAQAQAQKTFTREKAFFDFSWKLRKKSVASDRIEGTVEIAVPYASIWFKEEEGLLRTTLEANLKLLDTKGELFWETKSSFEVALAEDELKRKMRTSFKQEIPFLWEGNLKRLRPGKSKLFIRLKNLTGGDEQQKIVEITL
ncbi:MAG: GWxTD domain-containing protein [Candidatus Aminicenantales bacterium]